jgi:hypothetical protein
MKKFYFLVFLVISTIYAVAQNNAGCPNANLVVVILPIGKDTQGIMQIQPLRLE